MPKATLEFSLPEEEVEYAMANKAEDMWGILHDVEQELRSHLKWNSHPEWDNETVEQIRKMLLDAMVENGINFN